MKPRWKAAARAVTCLALAAAMPAPGQEPPTAERGRPGFEIERAVWVGSAGGGVTVVNRFGDVRARFGGYEGRVEVVANVQHFASEGPRLTVEAKESGSGVAVEVGYRSSAGGELITVRDPVQRKRADLAVYVPLGAPLSVATDGGLIDVRGLKCDVRARTVSGEITARKIDGELRVETRSGAVLALLEGWSSERSYSFASESGEVSIHLAGEVNARVDVETSGLVSTDYSMEIDYRADRRPVRRGRALIGKGSSAVEIVSASGHVRLVRRPLAREALVRPRAGR